MSARSVDRRPGSPDGAAVDPALEARGVSKAFGATQALRDCWLTCEAGTVHAILGENGSGKSTLMKLLAGLLPADRGAVRIGAHELASATPRAASAAGVAAVLQEVLVAPNRSVVDNVLMGFDGLFRRRLPRRDRRRFASQALARVGASIPDPLVPVETLPLSVQQQVVIARALVQEPTVVLLDEATAALDADQRDRLFACLRRLVDDGMTIVFISHRMDEVMSLSDRVTVLRSGTDVATLDRGELEVERLLQLMIPDHPAGAADA